ncbi:MAG: hypothetical protein AB1776_08555 [Bacillota bacterium]
MCWKGVISLTETGRKRTGDPLVDGLTDLVADALHFTTETLREVARWRERADRDEALESALADTEEATRALEELARARERGDREGERRARARFRAAQDRLASQAWDRLPEDLRRSWRERELLAARVLSRPRGREREREGGRGRAR